MQTWSVAVDAPLGPLHYLIPDSFDLEHVVRGRSVLVPLGSRKVNGVLLRPIEQSDASSTASQDGTKSLRLKSALEVFVDRPVIPEVYLEWVEWLSRYYVHPLGQILEMVFPPLEKGGGRRRSRKSPVVAARDPLDTRIDQSLRLTEAQTQVVDAIDRQRDFGTHLLFGVTGSGKTEVYMELIARTIARGQQALVLVPEIALTPQLIERFARRFGEKIAVIHSHLTPREKTDNWWSAIDGSKPVLIGARSALFCPLDKLGLIVIDEEHEPSFKQDDSLRYHARDAAIMLAKLRGHPIVLGSATPSLETWHNATTGRFSLHRLPERALKAAMPTIEVVDLRDMRDQDRQRGKRDDGRPFWLSEELLTALRETLEAGEQAALFLNRRGIAQSVVCPTCGDSPQCPNCEVALTLHGRSDLLCHYCDFHESLREKCGHCHEGEPKPLGLGTERIEHDLMKLFPSARLIRMDRDEIQSREDLESAIKKVEEREVDILIGTQMIAKGLDFPGLTLVGLVLADIAFNLPDFRASERAFQLLTQVAGRSGRHLKDRPGRVFLQTYNPDHPSIQFTLKHDYAGFASHDLQFREPLHYPPYGRLSVIKLAGPDLGEVQFAATRVADLARKLADAGRSRAGGESKFSILGPAPAPLAKLRNQFRFQILVKGADPVAPVSSFCRTLSEQIDSHQKSSAKFLPPKVKVAVDIDALNLL